MSKEVSNPSRQLSVASFACVVAMISALALGFLIMEKVLGKGWNSNTNSGVNSLDKRDAKRDLGGAFELLASGSKKGFRLTASDCPAPYAGVSGLPTLVWPLEGKKSDYHWHLNRWDYDWSDFGSCGGQGKTHNGLDISAEQKTKVFAAYGGTIIEWGRPVQKSKPDWASRIVIAHVDDNGNEFTTTYMHIDVVDNPELGAEKHVDAGKQIATVAHIDPDSGDHLHFSIRRHLYDGTADRGALPSIDTGDCKCKGDPVFPEFFIDPAALSYSDAGTGCNNGSSVSFRVKDRKSVV